MELQLKFALLILLVLSTISPSTSSRTIERKDPLPSEDANQIITFFMNDVLGNSHRSAGKVTGNNGHHPSLKPKGSLPRNGRVPYHHPTAGSAVSPPNWLPFHGKLQGLEPGIVTIFDEEIINDDATGMQQRGRMQGVYVTSSENTNNRMVAMKATFNGDSEDSLRFFGVHRSNIEESHIAVIGGTGKYQTANGFAVVKAADLQVGPERDKSSKILLVTVYLK